MREGEKLFWMSVFVNRYMLLMYDRKLPRMDKKQKQEHATKCVSEAIDDADMAFNGLRSMKGLKARGRLDRYFGVDRPER